MDHQQFTEWLDSQLKNNNDAAFIFGEPTATAVNRVRALIQTTYNYGQDSTNPKMAHLRATAEGYLKALQASNNITVQIQKPVRPVGVITKFLQKLF